jgi:uncharacterized protein with HEPN domain
VYFDVDLEKVWKVVTEDLDVLIETVSPLIPPPDEDDISSTS